MKKEGCIVFSGGVKGAEAEFASLAEEFEIEEVNFTFEGHQILRKRGVRFLNREELLKGDVSLSYVSRLMNRKYSNAPLFTKILQGIWHVVNSGQEVFVVGKILQDKTVKGGTGWGAEFAKLCNKPLYVFDQDQAAWFRWSQDTWKAVSNPKIKKKHISCTGTRFLNKAGKKAIRGLFERSFRK